MPTDAATLTIRIQDDPANGSAASVASGAGPGGTSGPSASYRPSDPAGSRPVTPATAGLPAMGVFANRNSMLWPFLQGLAQVPATGLGQDFVRSLFARPYSTPVKGESDLAKLAQHVHDAVKLQADKDRIGTAGESGALPAARPDAVSNRPTAPAAQPPAARQFRGDVEEPDWYKKYNQLQNRRDMGNWSGPDGAFKNPAEESEYKRLKAVWNEFLEWEDSAPPKSQAGSRIEPPAGANWVDYRPPQHHNIGAGGPPPPPNRPTSDIGDGPFTPNSKPRGRGRRGRQMWARLRMFNRRTGPYTETAAGSAGNSNRAVLETFGSLTRFSKRLNVASASIDMFSHVADAFVARGKELAKFSGELASANARADVRSTLADVREANRLGDPLARLTDSQSRIDESIRDLVLPIKEILTHMLAGISEIAAGILDIVKTVLGPILNLVGTVGGFLIDIVAMPIAKIIETVNQAAKAVIALLPKIPTIFGENEDEKFNKITKEVLGLGDNLGPPGGVLGGAAAAVGAAVGNIHQQAVSTPLLGI